MMIIIAKLLFAPRLCTNMCLRVIMKTKKKIQGNKASALVEETVRCASHTCR